MSDPVDVDRIAETVLSTPGVASLHAGAFGEVGTYLPGRRVAGIRQGDDGTHVHVVLHWDAEVLKVGDAVRDAVESLTQGPVHVVVEDIEDPNAPDPAAEAAEAAEAEETPAP